MNRSATPRRVAVIGAGIVGLSAAWYLQQAGLDVDVFDTGQPGAGASHGNAGWITPDRTEPLPSPAILRTGLTDLLRPHSPVAVADLRPATLRFLTHFTRACTPNKFQTSSAALQLLANRALDAYDKMLAPIGDLTKPSPILAVFSSTTAATAFAAAHPHQEHRATDLTLAEARRLEPSLGPATKAAVVIEGQRYCDPAAVTLAIADTVTASGGRLLTSQKVTALRPTSSGVDVVTAAGVHRYDAIVVAAGVESSTLLRKFRVRTPLLAGRGYSFTINGSQAPTLPIYVPEQRLACTPLQDGYRVVGVMEIGGHGRPPTPGRIHAMAASAAPYLQPDGSSITPTRPWVGSRPCTADGLPLIGPTACPRIHAATGHGMWGVTFAAATGELVAGTVLGQESPIPLAAFSPLR